VIRTVVATLPLTAIVLLPARADAACHQQVVTELVLGVAQVNTKVVCDGEQTDDDATPVGETPPRDSDLDPICTQAAISNDVDPFLYCDVLADPSTTAPEPTPGLVARAFKRIPLPEAKLIIQPPNGRTLVNFETNFYTEQGEFTRTVTLLGRQVELRIWPASFAWRFGDGESQESTSPGSAYPGLEITHEYQQRGPVSPSVDTTYAAQFRVGQGPWRDVAGTVTIPGSPQELRVVEARPVLVGG
jgi:hypothetical protein